MCTCTLFISIYKYTFDSTCTLLKYFLITTGVRICTYTQVPNVSTFKYLYFTYRIASNYCPGIYFFLAIFNQATKQDRHLLSEEC